MKTWLVFLPLLTCAAFIFGDEQAQTPASDARIEAWIKDSRLTQLATASDAKRAKWLDDENPFLRKRALAYLGTATSAQIKQSLEDSDRDVREAALWRAIHDGLRDSEELLKLALGDPDPTLQAHATLALLQHGVVPPMKNLRTAGEDRDFLALRNQRAPIDDPYSKGYRELRFEKQALWVAISRMVDEDSLLMLQECALQHRNFALDAAFFEPLGRFIAGHPETIKRLAEGDRLMWSAWIREPQPNKLGYGFDSPYAHVPGNFAIYAVAAACPAILPNIYSMLRDPDHRCRILAAEVCGKMGDRASLKPLIEAFEKDDGLAMGAFLRILVQFKAKEAIPALGVLYEKINDEMPYNPLSYDERVWLRDKSLIRKYAVEGRPFTARLLPKGSEPVERSKILEAIERIGPEHGQSFYRAVGKKYVSYETQSAVARHLRPGTESENAESIAILLEIINAGYGHDSNPFAFDAALSLLYFDLRDGEQIILRRLDSKVFASDQDASMRTLTRLQEVPHAKRAFLDERLKELGLTLRMSDKRDKMIDKLLEH